MKVKVIVIKVMDSHNTERAFVCTNINDTIDICEGLKDNQGDDVLYYDKAYDLSNWCEGKGLTVTIKEQVTEI